MSHFSQTCPKTRNNKKQGIVFPTEEVLIQFKEWDTSLPSQRCRELPMVFISAKDNSQMLIGVSVFSLVWKGSEVLMTQIWSCYLCKCKVQLLCPWCCYSWSCHAHLPSNRLVPLTWASLLISAHLNLITLISHSFTHRPRFYVSPPVRGCCFVGFLLCAFVFWASIVCTFSWTCTCLPVSGCELLHQWITEFILPLSSVSIWVQFFIPWVWQMYYETHCLPFFDLFPHKWVLFLTTGVSHAERTLYLRLPVMPEPTCHFDFSLMITVNLLLVILA